MPVEVITLTGNLRLQDAEPLRARMQAALAIRNLDIDASGLASVDTSILQLMISARKSAVQMERKLQLTLPTDGEVPELAEKLGLTPFFGVSEQAFELKGRDA